ncbi:hypothetical protein Q7I60_24870, partial [Escherichia coli]|uniref:hypothetical protein n=1 Tax=Escherichia coli TaxID=562 RepID=UPI003EE63CA3
YNSGTREGMNNLAAASVRFSKQRGCGIIVEVDLQSLLANRLNQCTKFFKFLLLKLNNSEEIHNDGVRI